MENLRDAAVFVTGAGGFIGSHLARRLVEEGADVSVLEKGDTENLGDIQDRVKIHHGDLTDYKFVRKTVRRIEPVKVYHLASCIDVRRTLSNLDKIVNVNILGAMNLLRSLEGIDYDCFINTGTAEEYGNIPAPFRETQRISPVSPYSVSKASVTMFCSMYHKALGFPIVTLRPFLTYGPCQDTKMFLPSLIVSALLKRRFRMSPGAQSREFNYVTDIVDGFIRASKTKKAIGEIINIGNGRECKIMDITKMTLNLMGNPIEPEMGALPYRDNEIMRLFCDNTKARELLKWKPRVGLEEGLKRTIEWYRENLKRVKI